MSDRPLLITLLGALTVILALFIAIIGAAFIIAPAESLEAMDIYQMALTSVGIALVMIAIVLFITGLSLLAGWTFAWYLGIVVYGITAVLSLISIPTSIGMSVVTLVVSLVVIYYLFRPRVKEFFNV